MPLALLRIEILSSFLRLSSFFSIETKSQQKPKSWQTVPKKFPKNSKKSQDFKISNFLHCICLFFERVEDTIDYVRDFVTFTNSRQKQKLLNLVSFVTWHHKFKGLDETRLQGYSRVHPLIYFSCLSIQELLHFLHVYSLPLGHKMVYGTNFFVDCQRLKASGW